MNIGEIRNVNGRLMGSIATRTIDLPRIGLRMVESDNERAPVCEVVALNVARRWVQIGALWKAYSKRTGEEFLAGSIDDPSLPEPLPVALFPTENGGFMIAWRRETVRAEFGGGFGATPANSPLGGGFGSPQRSYDERAGGGFGESTAGDDGSLVGAGADLDDDIPFS
ncbi:DUF736 family protein [Sphingomonas histidinilytica]|uniref:DUF736 domain-containing protein n=1 Tax=Sphingomonadales TaxID=204457 RepID=UPI0007703029|nr:MULTISPECIES: DUF736 domain-containing protein [Sphingomonadaceae]AMK23276.1 hypothetical protein K426_11705 [Sphingobium sp. TKS]MBO9375500.1 DUF736 family protein [Rhizorhabdus histidinilytica]MCF8709141.1 DUF736 domain-containing protein [Rhizorhapis sp. SPR117]